MSESVDKDALYGDFKAAAGWRERLYKSLAHKSLDIAEKDDMHVSTSSQGITGKDIVKIVAILAILSLGWKYVDNVPVEPPAATPTVAPQEFIVEFWDENGNKLEVENAK